MLQGPINGSRFAGGLAREPTILRSYMQTHQIRCLTVLEVPCATQTQPCNRFAADDLMIALPLHQVASHHAFSSSSPYIGASREAMTVTCHTSNLCT